MRLLSTFLVLLFSSSSYLFCQIKQDIIKGSNSNVIYQSFYSGAGGELQSIKISTDQAGIVTIKLFENEMQKSAENPIWEIESVEKTQSGELLIDFNQGHGQTKNLVADKNYCFSVVGGGNIHHSFLDDTYDGGNYRFEDGIERTGDLYFELSYATTNLKTKQEEKTEKVRGSRATIKVFPNPTMHEVAFSGLSGQATISVYDSEGKLHDKRYVQPNERLFLSELTDGLYYIHIKEGDEVYIKKVVKSSR